MSRKKSSPTEFSLESAGGRFGWARAQKGLTGKKLATILGCSPSLITEIEKDRVEISTRIAIGMFSSVGLNINWLLTGKGDPWASPARRQEGATLDPMIQEQAEAISRLSHDQRQAVAEIVAQLLKATESELRPEPAPKPKPEPPPAPTHTLRSGKVIEIDEYRARLSEDAQDDLTDEEVAGIAQFEESCVRRGVQFHEFSLSEIFTSSANRIRELIDMGRQVDLC